MKKSKQIRRILIANRGEIATRIISTCKVMGIRTVGVFSDIDRHAPHVRLADEAFHLGPSPARESYLNQRKIIDIALRTKSDAIHPGYGFLSENAEFAESVAGEGITFIGPTAESIRVMGDKTEARKIAVALGIAVVPGSLDPVDSVERAIEFSREVKYPILLKAAGGGGGKGMRLVSSDEELPSALRGARSEAQSAFGDGRVYVEKYIENPRHVEVQILADLHGNVLHLGERECSIQRRHQKIIEESPSVAVDDELRRKLTEAAKKLVRASKYTNAGTVEFVLDRDKNYYFLEMNTRLQVEHAVTEMRTGLDLVREQMQIAEGKKLEYSQDQIHFRGHAVECRIYAEDSLNSFLPSTGTIHWLKSPHGLGIREDKGVEMGSEISPYYDPMISKLIAWGNRRDEAISRLSNALKEYEIYGVRNNIDLCLWVLNNPEFQSGNIHTNLIRDTFSTSSITQIPDELANLAAIIATLSSFDGVTGAIERTAPGRSNNHWKHKLLENMR